MTEQELRDSLAHQRQTIERMQRRLRIVTFWTRVSMVWLWITPIVNGAIIVWVLYG